MTAEVRKEHGISEREKKKSRVPREDRAKETVAEDAAGERCRGHVTHRLLCSVRTFVFFKASGKTLNSLQNTSKEKKQKCYFLRNISREKTSLSMQELL